MIQHKELTEKLEEERLQHNDVLFGDFEGTYCNCAVHSANEAD